MDFTPDIRLHNGILHKFDVDKVFLANDHSSSFGEALRGSPQPIGSFI
jgi:hypothetical protein